MDIWSKMVMLEEKTTYYPWSKMQYNTTNVSSTHAASSKTPDRQ